MAVPFGDGCWHGYRSVYFRAVFDGLQPNGVALRGSFGAPEKGRKNKGVAGGYADGVGLGVLNGWFFTILHAT